MSALFVAAQMQVLFGMMFFIGAVLFIAWLILYKPDQIKMWMLFFLALGAVGSIISASLLAG